jgi:predicted F0F1-ATPase subunit
MTRLGRAARRACRDRGGATAERRSDARWQALDRRTTAAMGEKAAFRTDYAVGNTAQAKTMRRRRGRLRSLTGAAMLSTVGLTLAFSTIIGVGIGYLIDRWLHTDPIFTVIFLVIGTIAGFVEMIRTISQVEKQDEEQNGD